MSKANESWHEAIDLSAVFTTLQNLMHQVDDMRIQYDGKRIEPIYQHTNDELQKVYDALSGLGWHIVHEEVLKDTDEDTAKHISYAVYGFLNGNTQPKAIPVEDEQDHYYAMMNEPEG